jgi:hypothetical protein
MQNSDGVMCLYFCLVNIIRPVGPAHTPGPVNSEVQCYDDRKFTETV